MTPEALRQLDAWIAENVMGWDLDAEQWPHIACGQKGSYGYPPDSFQWRKIAQPHPVPHYTSPAGALEVLKRCCTELPLHIELMTDGTNWWAARPDMDSGESVMAPTLELAICLFARRLFEKEPAANPQGGAQ